MTLCSLEVRLPPIISICGTFPLPLSLLQDNIESHVITDPAFLLTPPFHTSQPLNVLAFPQPPPSSIVVKRAYLPPRFVAHGQHRVDYSRPQLHLKLVHQSHQSLTVSSRCVVHGSLCHHRSWSTPHTASSSLGEPHSFSSRNSPLNVSFPSVVTVAVLPIRWRWLS
jgi:hypothetical protein